MTVDELVEEIEAVAGKFAFIREAVKIDVTDFSVKYRLIIAEDFYVQAYINLRSGTNGIGFDIAWAEDIRQRQRTGEVQDILEKKRLI